MSNVKNLRDCFTSTTFKDTIDQIVEIFSILSSEILMEEQYVSPLRRMGNIMRWTDDEAGDDRGAKDIHYRYLE